MPFRRSTPCVTRGRIFECLRASGPGAREGNHKGLPMGGRPVGKLGWGWVMVGDV